MGSHIRLVYDATGLCTGLKGNAWRSGIFVTIRELLRELEARDDVEVFIYASRDVSSAVHSVLQLERGGIWERLRFWLEGKHAHEEALNARGLDRLGWFIYRVIRWVFLRIPRFVCNLRDHRHYVTLSEIMNGGFDAYLAPYERVPQEVCAIKIPRFTIVYDTMVARYPEYYIPPYGDWWRELVAALDGDDHVFAISESTRRDILSITTSLNPANVSVIPLAAAARFCYCSDVAKVATVREKYGIPTNKRYFLSMCTLEPRKNLPVALCAFARVAARIPDVVFVLAGGIWPQYEQEWNDFFATLPEVIRSRVIRVGYVDDSDQHILYSGAIAFVYLSKYEGFGLPPLEAMQCGLPVLTSNTSSIPEVVGDAGIMVAPNDIDSAYDAMSRLATDDGFRSELRSKGLARAKLFSWRQTVEIMVEKLK